MSLKVDGNIVYSRGKADAVGAIAVGCLLLVIAIPALTMESVGNIRFSKDLVVMSTYLGLPLGLVLIVANLRQAFAKGATVTATKQGVTIFYVDPPVGPIHWTEIKGFMTYRHQGKRHLGITLENPEMSLSQYGKSLSPLMKRLRPKAAHLQIDAKYLNDDVRKIVDDLEEQRQIYSWRG